MKINLDIDCTPKELRAVMGLPDLEPMQQAIIEEMQNRMMEAMDQMSPATLMRDWFTASGPMSQSLMNLLNASTPTAGGTTWPPTTKPDTPEG